jgi:hypothetical protein
VHRCGRLGCLLTIHSWQGANDHSGVEFIRTAGGNEVPGERLAWARATLDALVRDVRRARGHVSEKIWHPGLARDHMLAEHGAVTFRIEVTTAGQGGRGFHQTGLALLRNIASVDDWGHALPSGA